MVSAFAGQRSPDPSTRHPVSKKTSSNPSKLDGFDYYNFMSLCSDSVLDQSDLDSILVQSQLNPVFPCDDIDPDLVDMPPLLSPAEIRDIQLGFPVPLVSSNLSMPAFVESLSEEFVLSSSNELEFVADTGSTSHVLTNVEDVMQSSLIPLTTSIYFADGRSVRVTHKGDVNYFVKDCLVAPEFKFNLLSISKLADIGYTTSFSEDSMTIRDQKNNIIATGFKKRNLYFVKIARSEVGLVADVSDIKQAPSAIQTAGVTLNLAEKMACKTRSSLFSID